MSILLKTNESVNLTNAKVDQTNAKVDQTSAEIYAKVDQTSAEILTLRKELLERILRKLYKTPIWK